MRQHFSKKKITLPLVDNRYILCRYILCDRLNATRARRVWLPTIDADAFQTRRRIGSIVAGVMLSTPPGLRQ